jgi:predicted nucleotidyltransferase
MEIIYKIIKLLKPKYYNILTRILVIGGLSILSKPIWVEIFNVFLNNFEFSIIGKYDWVIGLVIILLALSYNTLHRYMDYKFEKTNEPAFKQTEYRKFSNFEELCQEILPILKDNEYVFKTTGPNSGSKNTGKLRTDLTMWEELKKEVIRPNNEAIKKLILDNKDIIPSKYEETFNKMVLHIDAFNKHIENPDFDYSEYQFPKEFSEIVLNSCYEKAKDNKDLQKILYWIDKKMRKIDISNWFIFGSSVLIPKKAKDIDLAVLIKNQKELAKVNKEIEELKFEFKIKFKKPLHISIFEETRRNDFLKFMSYNPLRIGKQYG